MLQNVLAAVKAARMAPTLSALYHSFSYLPRRPRRAAVQAQPCYREGVNEGPGPEAELPEAGPEFADRRGRTDSEIARRQAPQAAAARLRAELEGPALLECVWAYQSQWGGKCKSLVAGAGREVQYAGGAARAGFTKPARRVMHTALRAAVQVCICCRPGTGGVQGPAGPHRCSTRAGEAGRMARHRVAISGLPCRSDCGAARRGQPPRRPLAAHHP